ncbi:MAG: rhomboid family intramembrane serine protease [Flavobacteriia bacterium]|nr:rhomboid family intramembrane serine protease [Flavobacteriia bacterium]
MFPFFNNIPPVTKNILILNILFYLATVVLLQRGINLIEILGAHYLNSPLFAPFQVITHFFMHSPDIFHILFNMLMLVMFGSHLERIWGGKRFFIFYLSSAIGAFALYNGIGVFQIMKIKQELISLGYDITQLNEDLIKGNFEKVMYYTPEGLELIKEYAIKIVTPMVGASGAIFGIMAAFAFLFPNTQLMLLFPPIPIKAKYLIGAYFVFELFASFQNRAGDNVAHLAHVGGAIVGFALVFYWNKKNRDHFY